MKKSLLVVTGILIVLFALSSVSANAQFIAELPNTGFQLLYGDVSLDGSVSTGDAVILLKYCIGIDDFSAMQYINGDVNCDGNITTADAGVLLKHVAGIVKSLPFVPDVANSASDIAFKNYTFPKDYERLPYGRSYALQGLITSKYALTKIRIKITDRNTGRIEIDKSVSFDKQQNILSYNTRSSTDAIDNYIRFSTLTTGDKCLRVICDNTIKSDLVVYEASFRVGFVFSEIANYCYSTDDRISASEARKMLTLLNSLNFYADDGAKIIEKAVGYLGKKYSEMDCSKFVQTAVKNGIDVSLPRTSYEQALYCVNNDLMVDYSELKAGDLIFMGRYDCDCGRYHEIHHSALYVGRYDGVDYIMESSSSIGGVVMRRMWGKSSNTWFIDSYARVG